jgi:hypothetical protein
MPARANRGVVAVEFSLVLLLFVLVAFGVLELARVLYLYNTLQMVTQRAASAAAVTDYRNAAAMNTLRQRAVLRTTPGTLAFGEPVSDAHVRIDYLSLSDAGTVTMTPIPAASLPSCPVNNRINCMKDPYGASCIRLVRAQICDPAVTDSCVNVRYQGLFSLVSLPVSLPRSTAIVSAETLGAVPGDAPCP